MDSATPRSVRFEHTTLPRPAYERRDATPPAFRRTGVAASGWHSYTARPTGNDHFQNVPSGFELFLREPGEKCVRMEPETRVPNAAMFYFTKEDHTLGNLLRAQLLKNMHVWFSAYKVPHPLFPNFELRVQTDGQVAPKEAVQQACRELIQDMKSLKDTFASEWELKRVTDQGAGEDAW